MTADLNVKNYDGDKYYMWDAQQNYWAGHEWNSADPWQPVLNWGNNPNYAQSSSDLRYYGMSNPATHAPCKDLPNVNEMTWYAMKGDPRWDRDELWATMGHLRKGGIWILKKVNITGYSKEKAYNGTDFRITNAICNNTNPTQGLPSALDANKYFYLPALGYYATGYCSFIGTDGYYWSSSGYDDNSSFRYMLHFVQGGGILVDIFRPESGCSAQMLFE